MPSGVTRSEEEIKEVLENLEYTYIDGYQGNANQRKVIVQDEIGYKYDVRLDDVLRRQVNFVGKNNPFSLENIDLWLKLNNSQFELLENNEYTGCASKLNLHCNNCKDYPQMSWANILAGKGCGVCKGFQVGEYHNLAVERPDIAKDWHQTLNGDLTPYDVTCGSEIRVWWLCPKGHKYRSTIKSRTKGHGCPTCRQSKGEDIISKFLIENNINFEQEFPLEGCRDKGQLYLDFCVHDCKIGIEYNGRHHYKPVRFSYSISEEQAKENLKDQKKKDKIKEKYCKDNNIRLIIIPYWEFDNIEKILKDSLL